MKKSVKIIFTLSIILNLLLLGTVGGHIYRHAAEPGSWHQLKKNLTPETKKVMRETFKRSEMFSMFREVRKKRSEIEKVLTAEEFDPDAYDVIAQEIQALNIRFSAKRLEHIKEVASKLPQEERQKLAKHAVSRLFGKSGHRKGKRKTHGDMHQDMQGPLKSGMPNKNLNTNTEAEKETNQ